ncbi:M16 family metallopeptidase [Propionivibrio limicola]|uniref:M16 family metallopeptidase n=1 Tax=Propionivibrio limicola TaxID=167645 RepID=UPI001292B5DC|nr:pitrilysin family protein [Propionivibrio limicola]
MKPIKQFAAVFLIFFAQLGLIAPVGAAAPKIEHWMALSGARVFFVENHDLPILDVQVDFAAGSAYDPGSKAGLAALTLTLLDLGVEAMDENRIANGLADLGAQLSGSAGMDRASVSLRTLSAAEKRGPALDILRAVLTRPQFPAAVFEREQARAMAGLKDALTRPETIANRAFWAAMYPDHAYGRQASPESVGALRRDDLAAFYRQHYTAQRAAVTIVGDVSRADAEALAQSLTSELPKGIGAGVPEIPLRAAGGEQRLAHPAAQAHLLIGLPALKRGDPDFFPLVVGNYTLGGGGFVSRLMKEVREKRGFAYSVHSYFQPLEQPGPFEIGLQTRKEQADDALRVTRDVLAAFLAEGPSADELQAAKQNLIGSFPLRLDSNRKLLDNVATVGFYGLPLDYLERYAENVEKVSAADIRAAFARRVRPESMVTVIVGPDGAVDSAKGSK